MIERFGEYGKNDLRKRGKKVKELIEGEKDEKVNFIVGLIGRIKK